MKINKETTGNSLRHFSEQLRSWISERQQRQPGPFRHVELSEQLISEQALTMPPITLWVNRESFIAGAVILIPPQSEDKIFGTGREITDILGLPCFFTWGRHEIACWSIAYDPPEKDWSFELPPEDTTSPAAFRKSFNLLMDQLEISFYTHQQSIPDASALHLANLVYATYHDLLPKLQQAFQLDNQLSATGVPSSVELKNFLLHQLLLPLALVTQDLFPGNISVERTTNLLLEAAEGLPASLKKPFLNLRPRLEMPDDCLRRYHHYISRVSQLKKAFRNTQGDVTLYLLEALAADLGGRPFQSTESDLMKMTINPAYCDLDSSPTAEIADVGILSACALIRHAKAPGNSMPQQYNDILSLNQKLSKHHIVGTLHEASVPKKEANKKLNTFLRVSWPNHKIALPVGTPVWIWQFIHLCGLLEGESRLELTIPKKWLWERYGGNLPEILGGKVAFTKIVENNDNTLNCTLLPASETPVTIVSENGSERILADTNDQFLRSQVLIALEMTDEIFNLLKNGELLHYSARQIGGLPEKGLSLYLKSSLGKNIWNLLAPGRPLPRQDKIATELSRIGYPLPGEKTIAALGRLKNIDSLSTNDIDQELSVWLGAISGLKQTSQKKIIKLKSLTNEEQLSKFLTVCHKEEIPIFPENYLYEIPSSERVTFTFNGRLQIIDSFFDEALLQDRSKQQLSVKGTPQKEALLLISTIRSGTIELPADQGAMTDILDRYIRDLKILRQNYYRLAVTYLPEEDILKKTDEVWKANSLPDWELIKER